MLGDLLDYVDYYDPAAGIIGRIFGAERVRPFIALRLAGDFPASARLQQSLWDSTADPVGTLTEVVAARYREVLRAVGPDALLTLGNVDVAAVWNEVAGGELPYLDAQTVEIAGRRMGFVAGGSARPGAVPTSGRRLAAADPLGRGLRGRGQGGRRRSTCCAPHPAETRPAALRRGPRPPGDVRARVCWRRSTSIGPRSPFRSRAPADQPADPAGPHRMRQCRPFPAVPAAVRGTSSAEVAEISPGSAARNCADPHANREAGSRGHSTWVAFHPWPLPHRSR